MTDAERIAWTRPGAWLAEDVVFVFEAGRLETRREGSIRLGTVGVIEWVGTSWRVVPQRIAEGIV